MKKFWVTILIFVIAIAGILAYQSTLPGKHDVFASCLVEKGAKMYGAWWCPHCQEQKKDFGKSWSILVDSGAYVECSTAQKTITELCEKENIDGYPTWRFADGSEVGGRVSIATLEAKTGCVAE
jgi:hypothetical protein